MLVHAYHAEWLAECEVEYPAVDAFVSEMGCVLEVHGWLDDAARVLACPLKRNPACWQHGRVVYAAAYRRMKNWCETNEQPLLIDIGTAKGFSALCMRMAADIARCGDARVVSIDVIDPSSRVRRNTVAEVDDLKTLWEIIQPLWDMMQDIQFCHDTGLNFLANDSSRIHFAFLDGKHSYGEVSAELAHLSRRQRAGDVVVADDVQIAGVHRAISTSDPAYKWRFIEALPYNETPDRQHARRIYAVGKKT